MFVVRGFDACVDVCVVYILRCPHNHVHTPTLPPFHPPHYPPQGGDAAANDSSSGSSKSNNKTVAAIREQVLSSEGQARIRRAAGLLGAAFNLEVGLIFWWGLFVDGDGG